MGDCQLEDLLDMMDDDEDEAMFAEAEAAALSQAPKSQNNSTSSSSGSVSEPDPEKEALKKQLEEMEKQMNMIKSQLGGAGVNEKKAVTEVDMFSTATNVSGDPKELRSPVKVHLLLVRMFDKTDHCIADEPPGRGREAGETDGVRAPHY